MLTRHIFFLLLLFPLFLAAQYPSAPKNYVTDEAGVLSQEQQQSLNRRLQAFEKESSNQIFVYIAPSLNGQDLESFSQEIFHNWQVGGKDKDNGVLITVFVNDRKFRIHTGYGLEGNLPDLLTKKIQDETMRPYFRQNDFYTGIGKGIDELIYYTAHAYEPEEESAFSMKNIGSWLLGYSINALLLILFSVLLFRKKPAKQRTPVMKGFLFTIALLLAVIPCIGAIFLFAMLFLVIDFSKNGGSSSYTGSSYSGSSYSDYNSSSDYSSYDSGSDFSGGGGGDSGGGGSSSDW